jgi:hypothetical protein
LIAAIQKSNRQSESSYSENVTRAAALFYFSKEVPQIASGIPLNVGKATAEGTLPTDDGAEERTNHLNLLDVEHFLQQGFNTIPRDLHSDAEKHECNDAEDAVCCLG